MTMTRTIPAPGNRCPNCDALGGTADSRGHLIFACMSVYRDGVELSRSDECRPGRNPRRPA